MRRTKAMNAAIYMSAALGALTVARAASAAVIISEVDPAGSSNTPPNVSGYNADWFELTNTGSSAVDITGWKMDDSSDAIATAVPIRDVTSIGAGQSVVFIENDSTDASTDAAIFSAFETKWFGSSVPAGFTIGVYGGSGVGLSQNGDSVNLFNSSGTEVVGVNFGITTLSATLDNSAGLGGTGSNNPTISTLSVAGVNGAFSDGTEIGSPGTISNTPEPASVSLMVLGAGAMLIRRRRRV